MDPTSSQEKFVWNEESWKSVSTTPGMIMKQNLDSMTKSKQGYHDKDCRIKWLVPLILGNCTSDSSTPTENDLYESLSLSFSVPDIHQLYCKAVAEDWPTVIELTNTLTSFNLCSAVPLPTTKAPFETQVLDQAFTADFHDVGNYRAFIYYQLNSYAVKWNPSEYYFPGVAVVQSSGTGKSRTLTSLVDLNVYVIYCSFMPKKATGYPCRSAIADYLMQNNLSASEMEARYASFFLACKLVVDEAIKENIGPKQLIKDQIPNGSGNDKPFWTRVQNIMEELKHKYFPRDPDRNKTKALMEAYFKTRTRSLKILIILDEVTSLIEQNQLATKMSTFACMRRGGHCLPSSSGIFITLLDTTASVSNLASPKSEEKFERALRPNLKLYEPIYFIASFDFARPDVLGLTLDEALKPEKLFAYGRALWPSLLEAGESVSEVRLLAASKLMGGGHDFRTKKLMALTEMQALSLLRARFPIFVCHSSISSNLVAGYMWHCVFISLDRWIVTSTMPSEPILSEAASLWLSEPDFRADAFDQISTSLTSGTLESGTGGEITAQALWILARDKVAAVVGMGKMDPEGVPFFSVPLRFKHVLFALLDPDYAKAICRRSQRLAEQTGLPDVVALGMVSYTHFVYVHDFPSMEQLLLFFARGAAVTCRVGETGSDLVIPVLMPDSSGNYVLDVKNLTYVYLQMKNFSDCGKDKHHPPTATSHLIPTSKDFKSFPPRHLYISLYMRFGGRQTWHEMLESDSLLDDNGNPIKSCAKLEGFLIRDKNNVEHFEKRWLEVQMATLTNDEKEILRRHRQVCVAILGFDHYVYPCILSEPFNPDVIPDIMEEPSGKTKPLCRKKVHNYYNPNLLEAQWKSSSNMSKNDMTMLKSFHVMLRSAKDPAAFQKTTLRSNLVKSLCNASYPETLTDPKFRETSEKEIMEKLFEESDLEFPYAAKDEAFLQLDHRVMVEVDDDLEVDDNKLCD